jgi:bifunctional DNase/RNase
MKFFFAIIHLILHELKEKLSKDFNNINVISLRNNLYCATTKFEYCSILNDSNKKNSYCVLLLCYTRSLMTIIGDYFC